MLNYTKFAVGDFTAFKYQLLNWATRFNSCCFLDNHLYQSAWQQQECLLAVGEKARAQANAGNALPKLQQFLDEHNGQWIFGHLGFGLQQETENIKSKHHTKHMGFNDLYFFVPQIVLQCTADSVSIFAETEKNAQQAYDEICGTSFETNVAHLRSINYAPQISASKYVDVINALKQHIKRGDCYEINFCQEFVAEEVTIHPVELYHRLSNISPNPFSCYYKVGAAHLACASPERYIMKNGQKIISQPIKGTAQRNFENVEHDEKAKTALRASDKDQRENVMIVDLVRNDLAKICESGTVEVKELFGVYSYPQVHQMISTIEGKLRADISFTDIIKATFPMGSMTGAPKLRVLQLIDEYEISPRGIFSGAVGYISPSGNFDFNVVIRSIVYNTDAKKISFHVGGGITHFSKPELEYQECMWKAAAIQKVLNEMAH